MDKASAGLSGYVEQISRVGGELAPMVVKAMILLLIVLLLIKLLGRLLARLLVGAGMAERKAEYSVTALHLLILIIGALVVLNLVGFPAVLLFRVVMVIVMAGFAAYVITKPYLPRLPFNKGDLISVGGVLGTVESITFVQTCLRTLDGKLVFLPNHRIMSDKVTNSSALPNRRIDIDFFIPYDQDVEKVKRVVGDILEEDKRVLEKPAPKVVIAKFSPNYLEMQARLWVQRKNALSCRWDLNFEIKSKFDEAGIVMASPRLEIKAKE